MIWAARQCGLFYDPSGQSFQAHLVALDAFLAGNDLLYMGNIISSEAKDNYSSVVETMDFFTQKYLGDTAFAKRVDDAVLRILTVKYHLYGDFSLGTITPPETGLTQIGQSEAVTLKLPNNPPPWSVRTRRIWKQPYLHRQWSEIAWSF